MFEALTPAPPVRVLLLEAFAVAEGRKFFCNLLAIFTAIPCFIDRLVTPALAAPVPMHIILSFVYIYK